MWIVTKMTLWEDCYALKPGLFPNQPVIPPIKGSIGFIPVFETKEEALKIADNENQILKIEKADMVENENSN